jgi:hypothetical protein
MQHQKSTVTKLDRYPDVFKVVSDIGRDSKDVLSFGCSTGEEIETLQKYFPKSEIFGVDINSDCVATCKAKFGDEYISNYHDFTINTKKYDVIFAMSVLCKWEDSQFINDCSELYPFVHFDKEIRNLDKKLNDDGLLVIYNSNFCFFESYLYDNYIPIHSDTILDSGFVHKFSSNNKKIDINYRDVIFLKKNLKNK